MNIVNYIYSISSTIENASVHSLVDLLVCIQLQVNVLEHHPTEPQHQFALLMHLQVLLDLEHVRDCGGNG